MWISGENLGQKLQTIRGDRTRRLRNNPAQETRSSESPSSFKSPPKKQRACPEFIFKVLFLKVFGFLRKIRFEKSINYYSLAFKAVSVYENTP